MTIDATAVHVKRTRLFWAVPLAQDQTLLCRCYIAIPQFFQRNGLASTGALVGRVLTLHGFAQGRDRQLARLLAGDLPVPSDRQALAGAFTISVVNEIRSASAWLHKYAEPFQITAPEGELLRARKRDINDCLRKLRHSRGLTKKTHQRLTTS